MSLSICLAVFSIDVNAVHTVHGQHTFRPFSRTADTVVSEMHSRLYNQYKLCRTFALLISDKKSSTVVMMKLFHLYQFIVMHFMAVTKVATL